MRVDVVGGTGAVGSEILPILEDRPLEIEELVPVASPRSAGRVLPFRHGRAEVRGLSPEVFDGVDVALFDVPDDSAAPVGSGGRRSGEAPHPRSELRHSIVACSSSTKDGLSILLSSFSA